MSTETHPEAAGLAEAIERADDRWQHGIGAGGFGPPETAWQQALAAEALSWLAARLTDDDVVEAAARGIFAEHEPALYAQGDRETRLWLAVMEQSRDAARAALSAAAAVIGGESRD